MALGIDFLKDLDAFWVAKHSQVGSQNDPSQASATPWLDGPVATAPVAIDEEMAKEEAMDAVAEDVADAKPSPTIELQTDPEPEGSAILDDWSPIIIVQPSL